MTKLTKDLFTIEVKEIKGDKIEYTVRTQDGKVAANKKTKNSFSHVAIALDKYGYAAIGFTNNPDSLKSKIEYFEKQGEKTIVLELA